MCRYAYTARVTGRREEHEELHRHQTQHRHGDHAAHGPWERLKHLLVPHSHDHTDQALVGEEARRHGVRAAWISLVVMGATALGQVLIVWLSGSVALLADTLHNIGHLATTIPLLMAFRLAGRAPTSRYPYGLRRAEDLVGLLIAAVIALSAAVIIIESIRAFTREHVLTHLGWVLAAGLVGFLGNELVAHYRIRAGRRIGSAALIAEGNHARADGLTSLAVVVSALAAWAGFPQLDPVIGLLIGGFILWLLVASLRSITRRLLDGVDDGLIDRIRTEAATVPGVGHVALVRARWSGHTLHAEVDVDALDAAVQSHAQAHALAGELERVLLDRVPHLAEVRVRVLPSEPVRPARGARSTAR